MYALPYITPSDKLISEKNTKNTRREYELSNYLGNVLATISDRQVDRNEQELKKLSAGRADDPKRFDLQNRNDLLLQEKQANIDTSDWVDSEKKALIKAKDELSNTTFKSEPRDNTTPR